MRIKSDGDRNDVSGHGDHTGRHEPYRRFKHFVNVLNLEAERRVRSGVDQGARFETHAARRRVPMRRARRSMTAAP